MRKRGTKFKSFVSQPTKAFEWFCDYILLPGVGDFHLTTCVFSIKLSSSQALSTLEDFVTRYIRAPCRIILLLKTCGVDTKKGKSAMYLAFQKKSAVILVKDLHFPCIFTAIHFEH